MTKAQKREEVKVALRDLLHPGTSVYYMSRAKSCRNRNISLFVVRDGDVVILDDLIVQALPGLRTGSRAGGILFPSKHFRSAKALIHGLSALLYPDGFACVGKENCSSIEHHSLKSSQNYEPYIHKDIESAFLVGNVGDADEYSARLYNENGSLTWSAEPEDMPSTENMFRVTATRAPRIERY